MVEYTQDTVLELNNTYLYSKNRRKETRSNDIITFDIEVTSLWKIDGEYKPFSLDIDEKKYRDTERIAIPYIWQAGVNDVVYYSRDFDLAKDFFDKINSLGIKCVCWVHNLSYEFEFLRNLYIPLDTFARKSHAVMKTFFCGIENIEFRCSYMLTRLSLGAWGKQCGVKKLVGDLDYNVYRSPYTPMTDKEMAYCEHDILVMYKGLQNYLNKYGRIHDIPLTQTGEIRLVVKKMMNDNGYNRIVARMQPSNKEEYDILLNSFLGGETHANYCNANVQLTKVMSKDYSSSYPFNMVVRKFPQGRFLKKNYIENDSDCLYILHVKLYNVESKTTITYIHRSKCLKLQNGSYDNGRVINASMVELVCTCLDFEIIKKVYNCDIEIIDSWGAISNYMPREFITLTLQKYCDKCALKNKEGFEDIYLQAKQFINGVYGMSVTKIIQESVLFNNDTGEWKVEEKTIEELNRALKKHKSHYSKNFLSFSFGVFVTAYARKMLMDIILAMPFHDVVYYDTDSIKFLNYKKNLHIIDEKNKENLQLLENIFEVKNIDRRLFSSKDSKGNTHIIGQLEDDGFYDKFITLGAKKYYYEENGEKYITVSGVPKNAVKFFDSIDDFKTEVVIPPYLDGKRIVQYNNEQEEHTFKDSYTNKYKYGVNIRPCSTTISTTEEYLYLIGALDM